MSSKQESPLRQYFRIRPVIVEDEPEAQRIEFHVGNQTFEFGPKYCESKEHAEWFVSMAIKAMHNAFKGMCNKCDGHGYIDEGDPDSGPCPTTCDECGGKGKTTPDETSAPRGPMAVYLDHLENRKSPLPGCDCSACEDRRSSEETEVVKHVVDFATGKHPAWCRGCSAENGDGL